MAELTDEEVDSFYKNYLEDNPPTEGSTASAEDQVKAVLRYAGNVYRRAMELIVQRETMSILTGVEGFDPEQHNGFTVVGLTVYGTQAGGLNLQYVVLPAANQANDLTREHMQYMGSTLGFDVDKITTSNVKN